MYILKSKISQIDSYGTPVFTDLIYDSYVLY